MSIDNQNILPDENQKFSEEYLLSIFKSKKIEKKKSVSFEIAELQTFFPKCNEEEIKENIIKIIEKFFSKNN